MKSFLIVSLLTIFLTSCKKNEPTYYVSSGTMSAKIYGVEWTAGIVDLSESYNFPIYGNVLIIYGFTKVGSSSGFYITSPYYEGTHATNDSLIVTYTSDFNVSTSSTQPNTNFIMTFHRTVAGYDGNIPLYNYSITFSGTLSGYLTITDGKLDWNWIKK